MFTLGLHRRSLGLWLLLFVLNQLWKHLLEGVDRFLLSMNHIKLLPLDLGLLFKVLGHFFSSSCHIAKASFSMEEFEACDSVMAECALLTSMPWARAL